MTKISCVSVCKRVCVWRRRAFAPLSWMWIPSTKPMLTAQLLNAAVDDTCSMLIVFVFKLSMVKCQNIVVTRRPAFHGIAFSYFSTDHSRIVRWRMNNNNCTNAQWEQQCIIARTINVLSDHLCCEAQIFEHSLSVWRCVVWRYECTMRYTARNRQSFCSTREIIRTGKGIIYFFRILMAHWRLLLFE